MLPTSGGMNSYEVLARLLPNLMRSQECPRGLSCIGGFSCVGGYIDNPYLVTSGSIAWIIVHLNDEELWSREQIADWLESLDVDLTFPTPEIHPSLGGEA